MSDEQIGIGAAKHAELNFADVRPSRKAVQVDNKLNTCYIDIFLTRHCGQAANMHERLSLAQRSDKQAACNFTASRFAGESSLQQTSAAHSVATQPAMRHLLSTE